MSGTAGSEADPIGAYRFRGGGEHAVLALQSQSPIRSAPVKANALGKRKTENWLRSPQSSGSLDECDCLR